MRFDKEKLTAELGIVMILAMSLTALLLIYYHYRIDYKWAAPLSDRQLRIGELRHWQYDNLLNVKQMTETRHRRARRLSEFERGATVEMRRVSETWAMVQKGDMLYLSQRFLSSNIVYGSPAQAFFATFVESDVDSYLVVPATAEQQRWLLQQRLEYPHLSVRCDLVLKRREYPRTTVLFSSPFIVFACIGLAITLLHYARRLVGKDNSPHRMAPLCGLTFLLFLVYMILMQLT